MGKIQFSPHLAGPAVATRALDPTPADNGHVVELIYRDQIPEFVASALTCLYENVYCTLPRIATFDTLKGISTYVRGIDSTIHTVILFRDEGSAIRVVNQQIALKKAEIEQFAKKIFAEYRRAETILFYALDIDPCRLSFPFQHLAALEENVICFPAHADDYLKSLKGQFRKQLRVGSEQLLAAHPGYQVRHYANKDIDRESVMAILAIAAQRMQIKGKADYTRDIDVDALTRMLRVCGHMTLAWVDDRICGGALWFSVGKRHFHQVAAHDAAYDRYMLGNQVWLASILHSLRLGGDECWLMGGASARKARFGARRKVLTSFIVYRSRWHICLNLEHYLPTWTKHKTAQLKAALKTVSTKPTPIGRLVGRVLLLADAIT